MLRSLRLLTGFFVCVFLVVLGAGTAAAQENDARQTRAQGPKDFEKGEGGSFMRKRMDWELSLIHI